MSSTDDPKADKIRRLENAVLELTEEGHPIVAHVTWLDADTARAGVALQRVLPTQH
jgi:hypothetical protein